MKVSGMAGFASFWGFLVASATFKTKFSNILGQKLKKTLENSFYFHQLVKF